jgi:hypothetical protein
VVSLLVVVVVVVAGWGGWGLRQLILPTTRVGWLVCLVVQYIECTALSTLCSLLSCLFSLLSALCSLPLYALLYALCSSFCSLLYAVVLRQRSTLTYSS